MTFNDTFVIWVGNDESSPATEGSQANKKKKIATHRVETSKILHHLTTSL